MSGREVKGFVVTPTIAAVFLAALLGAMGWAYKSNTEDSRATLKSITRMETMLEERTRTFERQQDKAEAELKDERTLADLHRKNQDRKQTEIVLALKQQGITINE